MDYNDVIINHEISKTVNEYIDTENATTSSVPKHRPTIQSTHQVTTRQSRSLPISRAPSVTNTNPPLESHSLPPLVSQTPNQPQPTNGNLVNINHTLSTNKCIIEYLKTLQQQLEYQME